jgi:hypothetical protein
MLIGDTNGNRVVNASDIVQVKGRVGLPVSNANFRDDLNVDGAISSADVALVKSRTGNSVP